METTENSLTTSIRTMHPLLTCIECGSQGSRISFHTDQWSNGEGNARCKSCVGGINPWFARSASVDFQMTKTFPCIDTLPTDAVLQLARFAVTSVSLPYQCIVHLPGVHTWRALVGTVFWSLRTNNLSRSHIPGRLKNPRVLVLTRKVIGTIISTVSNVPSAPYCFRVPCTIFCKTKVA